MKKTLIPIISVLLVLLFAACAESTGGEPQEGSRDVKLSVICGGETVLPYEDESGKIFFLPSFASDALLSVEGEAVINGETVKGGGYADMLSDCSSFTLGVGDDAEEVRVMRSENLPAVFIKTDGGLDSVNASEDHSVYVSGSLSVIDESGKCLYSGELKKIRGRGNATWDGEKKPYQIELSSSASLLGLAKAKKYVLLANFYDPSLLRNTAALSIAENCGAAATPGFAAVDLYADGEYLGSYLLCEKAGIGSGRIEISELEKITEKLLSAPPESYLRGGETVGAEPGSDKWYNLPENPSDITGGYLLEVEYTERYPDEASGFVTKRGLPVVVKSPEYASREQTEYIKNYFEEFEDALFSEDGYNSEEKHYSDYADVDSLIFRYLLEEFTLNIDGGISSFYIYKDTDASDGRLNFSCAWDYDCSLGNYALYADLTSPEALFSASSETRNAGSMPNIFFALTSHEEIKAKICKYYAETFRPAVCATLTELYSEIERIAASAEMDYARYPDTSRFDKYKADAGRDFESAAEYLTDFVSRRISFFDSTFGMADKNEAE